MVDMLNEYKKEVHKEKSSELNKNIKFTRFLKYLNKNKWKIIGFIFLIIIIFFPSFVGKIIGIWLSNFFSNIIYSIF